MLGEPFGRGLLFGYFLCCFSTVPTVVVSTSAVFTASAVSSTVFSTVSFKGSTEDCLKDRLAEECPMGCLEDFWRTAQRTAW